MILTDTSTTTTQEIILGVIDEDIATHFSRLEEGSYEPLLPISIHTARHLKAISTSLPFIGNSGLGKKSTGDKIVSPLDLFPSPAESPVVKKDRITVITTLLDGKKAIFVHSANLEPVTMIYEWIGTWGPLGANLDAQEYIKLRQLFGEDVDVQHCMCEHRTLKTT